MRARVVMATAFTAIGLGCSTGGATSGTSASAPRASRQQDVITESEIVARASEASNALQIVQKLRPQMLRSRGRVSPNDTSGEASLPKVIVDDVAYGTIESLANLNASQVREIKYMNAADATTKWGTGYMGGVIIVVTKK
jgi:hypothetical protein